MSAGHEKKPSSGIWKARPSGRTAPVTFPARAATVRDLEATSPVLKSVKTWPGRSRPDAETRRERPRAKKLGLLSGKYALPADFFEDLTDEDLASWHGGSSD
jgi:hypothetical protein